VTGGVWRRMNSCARGNMAVVCERVVAAGRGLRQPWLRTWTRFSRAKMRTEKSAIL
jgi:hypothetical protein